MKASLARLLYTIIELANWSIRILTNAMITTNPKERCPFRHHSWRSKTMTSMKTSARLLLLRFSLNLEPRCLVSRPARRYFFIQPGVPSMGNLQWYDKYYPLPLEVAFSSLLQRVIAGTVDNIMESGIDLEDCLDMEMEGVAEMWDLLPEWNLFQRSFFWDCPSEVSPVLISTNSFPLLIVGRSPLTVAELLLSA